MVEPITLVTMNQLWRWQVLERNGHVNDRDSISDMSLLHFACKAGAAGIGDPQVAAEVCFYRDCWYDFILYNKRFPRLCTIWYRVALISTLDAGGPRWLLYTTRHCSTRSRLPKFYSQPITLSISTALVTNTKTGLLCTSLLTIWPSTAPSSSSNSAPIQSWRTNWDAHLWVNK